MRSHPARAASRSREDVETPSRRQCEGPPASMSAPAGVCAGNATDPCGASLWRRPQGEWASTVSERIGDEPIPFAQPQHAPRDTDEDTKESLRVEPLANANVHDGSDDGCHGCHHGSDTPCGKATNCHDVAPEEPGANALAARPFISRDARSSMSCLGRLRTARPPALRLPVPPRPRRRHPAAGRRRHHV